MNAQTKKRTLLGSMLVIVLCLSLIAGSTFALFTDEHKFNIAVTSGDVEIFASAEIVGVYSAKEAKTDAEKALVPEKREDDPYLVDEYDNFYFHEEQSDSYVKDSEGVITYGKFYNDGDVQFNDGVLTLNRITPGDRVDVTIHIENRSNVAFVYRYKLISNNTNLATGMVVTIDDTPYESLAVWTSDWKEAIHAPNGEGDSTNPEIDKTISIELPVYAGNEYQSEYVDHPNDEKPEESRVATGEQKVEYTLIVEAVQSNAITMNEEEFQIYQKSNVTTATAPIVPDANGKKIATLENLYMMDGNSIVVDKNIDADAAYAIHNTTFDVNGTAIVSNTDSYVVIYDCDFVNLDDGDFILNSANGWCTVMISDNCTIDGEAITQADVDKYFTGAGYYLVCERIYLN